MAHLPPDLSRIGDELAAAAARSLRSQRRRALAARWAATALVAGLAFAALTPARLGPAQGGRAEAPLLSSTTVTESVPARCDQPRGARFGLPACTVPIVAQSVLPTLPHGTSLTRE